jgi:hypothetical protein
VKEAAPVTNPLAILSAVTTILFVGSGLWLRAGVKAAAPPAPAVTWASTYPGIKPRMRHRKDWSDFDEGWGAD